MRASVLVGAALALVAGSVLLVQPATAQRCGPAEASSQVKLGVEQRPDHALVFYAQVDLTAPAAVYVEYGNEQSGWLRTVTSAEAASHRLPLLRLRADSDYQARAFALNAAECPAAVAAASFRSGTLPDQLRNATIEASGEASFGLILTDWPNVLPFLPPERQRLADRSRYMVGIDDAGQLVWYYAIPKEYSIPPPEASTYFFKQRANYNLFLMSGYSTIDEISPDGQLLRHAQPVDPAASRAHHDLAELADGRVLYLGADDRLIDDTVNGGPAELLVRGDTLHVLDLTTGEVEQVWNAFDALDPTRRVEAWKDTKIQGIFDWTHANAMAIGPSGNILVSNRHLDQVLSLSPDYKTIQWTLGGPGSSFSFPDETDRPRGQHGVYQLSNGNLLMFDNGNYRPEGEHSRVIELELDLAAMTARKVWEYRPSPDIFSDKLSNVQRLPNGNTFVSFGWREFPDQPALIQEVRSDGTIAWQKTTRWRGFPAARYRGVPVDTLAGEQRVAPTAANLP